MNKCVELIFINASDEPLCPGYHSTNPHWLFLSLSQTMTQCFLPIKFCKTHYGRKNRIGTAPHHEAMLCRKRKDLSNTGCPLFTKYWTTGNWGPGTNLVSGHKRMSLPTRGSFIASSVPRPTHCSQLQPCHAWQPHILSLLYLFP